MLAAQLEFDASWPSMNRAQRTRYLQGFGIYKSVWSSSEDLQLSKLLLSLRPASHCRFFLNGSSDIGSLLSQLADGVRS